MPMFTNFTKAKRMGLCSSRSLAKGMVEITSKTTVIAIIKMKLEYPLNSMALAILSFHPIMNRRNKIAVDVMEMIEVEKTLFSFSREANLKNPVSIP